MDDRKLLELAAKAAGVPIYWHDEAGWMRADRLGTVPWDAAAIRSLAATEQQVGQ
jgi:hypothetical protein